MGKSTVSEDIRAAALADLHAGEQPAVVAARYNLDAATVRVWKTRHVTGSVTLVTDSETRVTPLQRPSLEEYQARILDLVVANLEVKLTATAAIAAHVQNPEWLNKQSASDVANFFVIFDRSASTLLERLGRTTEPTTEPSE